jgi:hypothetical protein
MVPQGTSHQEPLGPELAKNVPALYAIRKVRRGPPPPPMSQ